MTVIAPEHRVVLIRIPKTAPADGDPAALYTATREWWRVGYPRTVEGPQAPTHALAVLKGEVIAAYAIDSWEQRTEDQKRRFHGRPADGAVAGYIGADVSDFFPRGSQTSIRYVNCVGAKAPELTRDRTAEVADVQEPAAGWAKSKHTQPWVEPDDGEEIRATAQGMAWLITRPGLHGRARRGLFTALWWFLTECNGKYGTRYRSLAALDAQNTQPPGTWSQILRHEHAVQRRILSARLLDADRTADAHWDVMREAVACIVTVEEDKAITSFDKTHVGWERYVEARITIVEMATGEVLTPADIAASLVTVED